MITLKYIIYSVSLKAYRAIHKKYQGEGFVQCRHFVDKGVLQMWSSQVNT